MFVYGSFTCSDHLRSYQDGYWLMTVHTHGDCIFLPTRRPGGRYYDLIAHVVSLSWYRMSQSNPILLLPSAKLGCDKYQFYNSLVWLDQVLHFFTFHLEALHSTYSASGSSISIKNNSTRVIDQFITKGLLQNMVDRSSWGCPINTSLVLRVGGWKRNYWRNDLLLACWEVAKTNSCSAYNKYIEVQGVKARCCNMDE